MKLATIGLTVAVILLWGLIPIFDKLALSRFAVSPWVGIAIRSAAVAVLAVPIALAFGQGGPALRAMPPGVIALYVTSGVVSLLLAQYCYYALLQQAEVSRVFPFLFAAAPLVTLVIGVVGLGESLTPQKVLGALLVIGGGILLL